MGASPIPHSGFRRSAGSRSEGNGPQSWIGNERSEVRSPVSKGKGLESGVWSPMQDSPDKSDSEDRLGGGILCKRTIFERRVIPAKQDLTALGAEYRRGTALAASIRPRTLPRIDYREIQVRG
jgi:hypothetical protein